MMSSVLLQWKCIGQCWPGVMMMIFSQYVLTPYCGIVGWPLRTVKTTRPICSNRPEPKSVMSQPNMQSRISSHSGPLVFQSSGDQ